MSLSLYYIMSAIVLLLCTAVKTFFFFKAARHRTFGRWVWFGNADLINAPNLCIKSLRKKQNMWTAVIAFLVLILAVLPLVFL